MRIEINLADAPVNTTPAINTTEDTIVFIPNDYNGIKDLPKNEIGLLEIDGESYDALAESFDLPECFDNEAQKYFADRCVEAQAEQGKSISNEGYAAIFASMMEDGISIVATIKAIPNIVSTHYEKTVQDIVDDAELQVAGLSDDERAGLAIGIITYEYNSDYDRHYDANGETMMLYCA